MNMNTWVNTGYSYGDVNFEVPQWSVFSLSDAYINSIVLHVEGTVEG